MAKILSRKQFIQSQGATCINWYWSWSFINEDKREVIFGAWDDYVAEGKALIFSEEWNNRNNPSPGYKQSREHIRLIEEEEYSLKIFKMINSDDTGNGPRKIKDFEQKLYEKKLNYKDGEWFAIDHDDQEIPLPEEVDIPYRYSEGTSIQIYVNSYERNKVARQRCLDHHGYKCKGCEFDFEKTYGSIGEKFIHVHHLKPIHSIKKEYQINPIKDLVPICPNCHAVIHRKNPPLTMDELRNLISNKIET
ncbi:MAG: HNH endonuclease [Rhodobacteraceae bacterium]|nr:HNH endonuclease [Paracoccaceae bacterium]